MGVQIRKVLHLAVDDPLHQSVAVLELDAEHCVTVVRGIDGVGDLETEEVEKDGDPALAVLVAIDETHLLPSVAALGFQHGTLSMTIGRVPRDSSVVNLWPSKRLASLGVVVFWPTMRCRSLVQPVAERRIGGRFPCARSSSSGPASG